MFKFIVFWVAVSVSPAPCPDSNKDNVDKYGVRQMITESCLVYHTKESTEEKYQLFKSSQEVAEFVGGMNTQLVGVGGGCRDIKIYELVEIK